MDCGDARMLGGRFKTQLDTSMFYKIEDLICKLCKEESEEIRHILVRCPILQDKRANKVHILQAIYEENQLPSPVEEDEICFAIVNGDCYIRSSAYSNPAAPNSIHIERDNRIHNIIQ